MINPWCDPVTSILTQTVNNQMDFDRMFRMEVQIAGLLQGPMINPWYDPVTSILTHRISGYVEGCDDTSGQWLR